MRLARFFASVLSLVIVLYVGISSVSSVFAVPSADQPIAERRCDCYLPNLDEYGILCLAVDGVMCEEPCLRNLPCDPPKDSSEVVIVK